MASTILIVDDDETQRHLLSSLAERIGYEVIVAISADDAWARLTDESAGRFDAALIDLVMPDLDGMALIDRLRRAGHTLPILALATPHSLDTVMSAIRAGANDFLVKPVAPERLAVSLANVIKLHLLSDDPARFTDRTEGDHEMNPAGFIIEPIMIAQCEKHAKHETPLLIEGEAGTGKSVLARYVHRASARRKKPCVSLAADSPLGGGRDWLSDAFRRAKGGTLVIESIDLLSVDDQLALVSLIQPLDAPIAVRVIATSSADLLTLIRAGQFREDLFYLITAGTLRIAPLRNRKQELHRIARQIVLKEAHAQNKLMHGLGPDATAFLESREWPGNIPELQALIRRALRYAEADILSAEDFRRAESDHEMRALLDPAASHKPFKRPQDGGSRPVTVELFDQNGRLRPFADIEADILREAHEHCRGRVAAMARHLGIGRSTIYRKLKELGLDSPAEADSMIGEAA